MGRMRARWWFVLGAALLILGLAFLRGGARVGVVSVAVAILLVTGIRALNDDGPEAPSREPPVPPGW